MCNEFTKVPHLAWRKQTLFLRKYHFSIENNSIREFSHRKQSYELCLNSGQLKLYQISRETLRSSLMCPIGPWLFEGHTTSDCWSSYPSLLYGNCWITAWTSDWPPEVSAESAAGAQVNAISPEWPEGVEPGSTLPRPHLGADSQGGRISMWRSLLLELFCEHRTWVRSLFYYSFVTW